MSPFTAFTSATLGPCFKRYQSLDCFTGNAGKAHISWWNLGVLLYFLPLNPSNDIPRRFVPPPFSALMREHVAPWLLVSWASVGQGAAVKDDCFKVGTETCFSFCRRWGFVTIAMLMLTTCFIWVFDVFWGCNYINIVNESTYEATWNCKLIWKGQEIMRSGHPMIRSVPSPDPFAVKSTSYWGDHLAWRDAVTILAELRTGPSYNSWSQGEWGYPKMYGVC